MKGKLLAFIVAALIGVAGTVAWYKFVWSSGEAPASASLSDAVYMADMLAGKEPDDSLEVKAPGIEGRIDAFEEGDLLVLRIQLDSEEPTQFHGQVNEPGLEFKSVINQSGTVLGGFLFGNGNFSIARTTSRDLLLVLESSPDVEPAPSNDWLYSGGGDSPAFMGESSPSGINCSWFSSDATMSNYCLHFF